MRISHQVEVDVRQVPRRILPLLKFQEAYASRFGIDEQRGIGGNITLDESRATSALSATAAGDFTVGDAVRTSAAEPRPAADSGPPLDFAVGLAVLDRAPDEEQHVAGP